jgi:hypothetical protein
MLRTPDYMLHCLQEPAFARVILSGYEKATASLAALLGAPVALEVKLLSLFWRRK